MIDHSAKPYYQRNFVAERIAARLVWGGFHPSAVDADYYGVTVNVRGVGAITLFETRDDRGPGAWTVQLYRYDQADPNRRYIDLDRNADPDEITADSLRGDLSLYVLRVNPQDVGQPDDE